MSTTDKVSPVDEAMLAVVETRLGRRPRGFRAVAALDEDGLPAVIRVASLVEGKPFPTLFWLIDPKLNLRIDREEANGRIRDFQSRIDADAALQRAMEADHQEHIRLRESYLQREERALLESRGQWSALAERGIGGIADFKRIRCLHTWYAAHLVEANTVGRMLDTYWAEPDCSLPPSQAVR
ncbi:DUF501 domain-containing protein [Congregibacter sp.]|uniref:DUF501 domain-containing protein n=1 Tax=Congregibacter sp. TaxID=2744308 RepID=UPI003F6D9321